MLPLWRRIAAKGDRTMNEIRTETHDPRSIANLILSVIHSQPTHLSLQKLLYFVHGAYLMKTRRPLVSGYFEAWNYGPVHPAVYKSFKHFGDQPINSPALKTDIRTGEISEVEIPSDEEVLLITKRVVSSLEHLSPGQLVKLSHAKGGPWDEVYRRSKSEHMLGLRISNEAIRERYRAHWFPADQLEYVDEPAEDTPLTYYRLG